MKPSHLAIIMDGNGRWAQSHHLPRVAGHKAGVETARTIIRACANQEIKILSLFAFSSENWLRPAEEVDFLMNLFLQSLEKYVQELHENKVYLHFIGDRSRLNKKLREMMEKSEQLTAENNGMKLIIAMNYSGRWDLIQAIQSIASCITTQELKPDDINAAMVKRHLSIADYPEPDLLIRTSGEQRISNFYLWELAYTELYFTSCYWPAFNEETLNQALQEYAKRQRRFGKTASQDG